MADPIRQHTAPFRSPAWLSRQRSELEELRAQAMFSDNELLSRRIRELEAQIEDARASRRSGWHRAGDRPRPLR